jgi:hypothetical protein
LLTLDSKVIRASTIRFAAEKRSLIDTEDLKEPAPKRLYDHSMHESWEDNDTELIQDTPNTTIAENTPKAKATPPQNTCESYSQAARTAEYHPLERALISYNMDDEPLKLFALLADLDLSEPYEPRTFIKAMSRGTTKQWELLMQDEVNSLKENNTWDIVDRLND